MPMRASKLPPVGIVIGRMKCPRAVIGLAGRPSSLPVDHWLGQLADSGCHPLITPVGTFEGSYIECPGVDSCDLPREQGCPLVWDMQPSTQADGRSDQRL